MIAESFKHASNFSKFIFVLFAILVGFTFFMVIGVALAIPLFGLDISQFTKSIEVSNPANIPVLKFLQAIYSIGLFVFPPIMIAFFFNGKIGEYLKINKTPIPMSIAMVCLMMFFALPLINFLMMVNESISFPVSLAGLETQLKTLEKEAQTLAITFLKANSFSIYLANMLVMAVIPAIGEEFLFRGVLQRLFKDWTKNIHIAIWLAAILFSAMHMQFYGFIPRMVLGAFFGYLLYWSGNLWLPVAAHFVNNGIAVTAFYLNNDIAEKADTIGTDKGLNAALLLSVLMVSLLIYALIKIEKEKKITNTTLEPDGNEQDKVI